MNTLVIACSDGRLAAELRRFMDEEGIRDADRFFVPGGPFPFTRPDTQRKVALEAVRAIVESHDIRTIYVFSHQECAFYERALGGLGFDQQELLERDLRRVKTLLETSFPGVDVRCYFFPWRENGQGPAYGPPEPVE